MAVRIVTDTAGCVSVEDLQRLSITTVPLHVLANGQLVPESELNKPTFYERLSDLSAGLSTSQPSPEEFVEAFRALLAKGHEVLAVLISAGLSGTIQSAELAAATIRAEQPDASIEIVDTRSNSLEEGFAVLAAAEAALVGGTVEKCRYAAEEVMRRTRFLFTPHSLEFLRRGGRITGAKALLSVMLRIVPILTAENGITGVAGVARSGRSAREKVASLLRHDVERCGLRRVAVQYVADEQEATRFAGEVIEPIAGGPVPIVPIHPIVGVHVGPAIGVVYETVEPLR